MTNPTISVVMSVYNGQPFLAEAVESILKQTFSDFEFIIIEDKSTDDSLGILQRYCEKDNRIILIKKDENKGVAGFIENLNIGLNHAKGTYVARLDADDISDPKRFEKQVKFLNENPGIFMVGSSLQCIDKNGTDGKVMRALTNTEDIYKQMPRNISMFHPVIMFRNNGSLRYRENMWFCEDYDLYLRMMTDGYKFANLDEPLLKYRILPKSVSRGGSQFIRWLFVENARLFYHQRKVRKSDDYQLLDPEALSEILTTNRMNKRTDLVFAARTAFRYGCDQELQKIIIKGEQQKFAEVTRYKYWQHLPSRLRYFFNKFG